MAISVSGQFLKSPHFAINCSPLLHDNFSQGVIPEEFSLCSPLLVIPEKSFHCSPLQLTLTWQFKSGATFEKSSLCNQLQPTLTWHFQSGCNFWKVLILQPIAAHSYMAISVKGVIPEKSSHCSRLQPFFTWQFQSGAGGGGVIPEKSSHCSPLQPTLTWQFLSGSISSKNLPLQPIAAHSYMAISVKGQFLKSTPFAINCSPLLHGNFSQGVIPKKSSLCSPLLVIPENSFHCSPLQLTLTWQFQSRGNFWKVLPLQSIAAHSYMAISVRG